MSLDEAFDAVIGRYVLPFQADLASMLRGLARHLEPGGLSGHSWNFLDRAHAAFVGAGLPAPTMRLDTYARGGRGCPEALSCSPGPSP